MFLVMNQVAIRHFGILKRAFCMKSRDLAIETIPATGIKQKVPRKLAGVLRVLRVLRVSARAWASR